jgi:hypothetical protein
VLSPREGTGFRDSRRSRRPWKRPRGRAILSGMTDQAPPPYELVIRACTIHAGRYRWDIRQVGTPIQSSMESFASPQEAHTDGRQVIERLTQVSRLGR